jgi:hypothetical protein
MDGAVSRALSLGYTIQEIQISFETQLKLWTKAQKP